MTVIAMVFLVLSATVARAGELNFYYHATTHNSFNSFCGPSDLVTGCGATCPPGQKLQKLDVFDNPQNQTGLQGCRANCQNPDGTEIKPVRTTAFCEHQECAPDGQCHVDP